ncbi:MAG: molybdopterin synthase sulfur carrier subunit [Epsilonproteobacteria bacterium]|nr:molybdopterin synthase sulfur carrier subunit [Campylobacterota bacterium]NPA63771.1 MoaD/ThiS family protein [Campylobacterota bacterium]
MVRVEFLGPIGKEPMEMEARSLKDVAKRLQEDPTLKQWLGQCAVAVNDQIVKSLDTPLKSGDKVSLLPPVCGG